MYNTVVCPLIVHGYCLDIAPLCPDCNADPTSSVFFWPCIIFGFLFFVLLVVLAFLLSAVTCSCVSSEVERKRDKERAARDALEAGQKPQEEFDPYTWGSSLKRDQKIGQSMERPLMSLGPVVWTSLTSFCGLLLF